MGKAARNARRAAGPKVRVEDAARLVKHGRMCAEPSEGAIWHHAANVIEAWEQDRVVARADPDLLGALVTTDRTTELPARCLQRFPLRSIAVSFAEPLVTHAGAEKSIFPGFFVTGQGWEPAGESIAGPGTGFAHPEPIPDADGVDVIWPSLQLIPGDRPILGTQRMTWWFEEGSDKPGGSINDLIDRLRTRTTNDPAADIFYDQLVPIAVMVMLYLTVDEPDFEDIPEQRLVRPQQLHRVRVANLGWRVGATLRAARALHSTGVGAGGWTLNPHMRSAHFKRSRVATRDHDQKIVGDIHGVYGIDWDYIRHWIPPTPVNCGPEGPAPVVRSVA